ncbi:MAG: class I SAM-dependent methyltransferase [Treponemataceae bacterium]
MGETGKEWFSEAAFWERFAPVMFDPDRWAEVPAVADGIERLAGKAPGKNPAGRAGADRARSVPCALDLCCGTGRISIELALRGWQTVGVDITASYLAAARESADDEGVALELIEQDVRRFVRPAAFDVALNLYVSFGYFDNAADDALLARNALKSLRPHGCFIIETLGKEIAVREFTDGEWFERGGYTVLTEFSVVDSWAALRNRWILLKDGERFDRSFDQRLYSGTELRRLLLDAGFSSVELYGEWDGEPYDEKARVLIAVARV